MTTQPSLDPRINPWKRGDVCTRHFDDVGFVVNCTRECIEVRWLERGAMGAVKKISADEMNYLRVGHADGPSLDGRGRTNLEALLSLEALDVIQSALANRTFKNDGKSTRRTSSSGVHSMDAFGTRKMPRSY